MPPSLKTLQWWITATCLAGVAVSLYALRVELKKEDDEDYEALCDISEHASCSRVLSSRWGKGFGIIGLIFGEDSLFNQPNSLSGILFYLLLAFTNQFNSLTSSNVLYYASIASNVISVYLACILYFVLYDLCIVCITTYAINAVLLALSIQKRKLFLSSSELKSE